MFKRLFEQIEQIEQQRLYYGDQVYDVFGDSYVNTSLQEPLIRAIREDADPANADYMDEIIDGDIGTELVEVLQERSLVGGLADPGTNDRIRDVMEVSQALSFSRGSSRTSSPQCCNSAAVGSLAA